MSTHSLFVLGGARSGKSGYAQTRAEALPGRHVFIATAEAHDDEMRERIAHHRAERGGRWTTIDAPRDLVEAIDARSGTGAVVLVDCLTLWTSNLMLADADMDAARHRLRDCIGRFDGQLLFVANEVGLGIVPDNPLARRFRDEAGRLNQLIAAIASEVVLLAAGIPVRLK